MLDCLIVLLSFITVFLFVYWKLLKTYQFWHNLGVAGPPPTFIIGNGADVLRSNRPLLDYKWAQQYGSVFGIYMGTKPHLVVTDPELIKQVLVKDFAHFANRGKLKVYHKMWNNNLLIAEDDDWKRVRTLVTPAFSSGKLKQMHNLINQCNQKLIDYLHSVCNNDSGAGIIADGKEVFVGYAIDVIASTSFATETNANDSRQKTNPVVHHGKNMFNFNPLQVFTVIAAPAFVSKLFGIKTIFQQASFEYLVSMVKEIVSQRKFQHKTLSKKQTQRSDFVQLLLDAAVEEQQALNGDSQNLTVSIEETTGKPLSKGNSELPSNTNKKHWRLTDDEVTAQCILFFAAGFETTASSLFNIAYELAKHQDVQEKLCSILLQNTAGIEPTSEQYFDVVLNQTPYLEAVLKECLRLYPPTGQVQRRVKTDGYRLAGIPLPKDTLVEISMYSVHRNERYYSQPDAFIPDRFMPENKDRLVPYTFMPFGLGPRNCVGMRFAFTEIKLCFAALLRHFRFERAPGTPDVPTFRKGPGLLAESFPIMVVKR